MRVASSDTRASCMPSGMAAAVTPRHDDDADVAEALRLEGSDRVRDVRVSTVRPAAPSAERTSRVVARAAQAQRVEAREERHPSDLAPSCHAASPPLRARQWTRAAIAPEVCPLAPSAASSVVAARLSNRASNWSARVISLSVIDASPPTPSSSGDRALFDFLELRRWAARRARRWSRASRGDA